MSVTVIVGGPRGEDARSKVAAYLALADQPVLASRAGANGHAEYGIDWQGQRHVLRQLPCAFVQPDARIVIGPGVPVNLDALLSEIDSLGVRGRLGVDPLCAVLRDDEGQPRQTQLPAGEFPELQPFLSDVPVELNIAAAQNRNVLIESVPGGPAIAQIAPQPTGFSFETTAQSCCMDVGLGPTRVTQVVLVLPVYTPPEAGRRGRSQRASVPSESIFGESDSESVAYVEAARRLALINGATQVALTYVEARYQRAYGVQRRGNLPGEVRRLIDDVENALGVPVALVSTGPQIEHIIDLR
ncbi:MAG: adenylosuccinate synthetase [Anaerolineae bacterium]